MESLRPAAVAGTFYPRGADALRRQIAGFLDEVAPCAGGAPVPKMLVVPHAGTIYSGPIAAHAYARVAPARGRITRVVLLGPSHRVALRGIAAPASTAFATPLGALPVDTAAVDDLVSHLPQVRRLDAAHAAEHSLEVQLPFVHEVLGEVAIVPLVVGDAAPSEVAAVVERLWGGDETLVVVSSDLSHYLRYDDACEIDRATVERLVAFDARIDHREACGATPLNGALPVARAHGLVPELLDLRNSGDTAGDRDRVVGYAAIAFCPPRGPAADAGDEAFGARLVERARHTIAAQLGLETLADAPADDPRLAEPAATFVTLRRGGELRGCAGHLRPTGSLAEDLRRSAIASAFHDSRFAPCTAREFDALDVEVSVLGPLEPLPVRDEADAIRRLRPGVDGVLLRWRGAEATFLPQVWAQLPDGGDFLAALKRKAGLPAHFWDDDVELWRYTVRHYERPRGERRGHGPH